MLPSSGFQTTRWTSWKSNFERRFWTLSTRRDSWVINIWYINYKIACFDGSFDPETLCELAMITTGFWAESHHQKRFLWMSFHQSYLKGDDTLKDRNQLECLRIELFQAHQNCPSKHFLISGEMREPETASSRFNALAFWVWNIIPKSLKIHSIVVYCQQVLWMKQIIKHKARETRVSSTNRHN